MYMATKLGRMVTYLDCFLLFYIMYQGGGGLSRFLKMEDLAFRSFSYNDYINLRIFFPKFAI